MGDSGGVGSTSPNLAVTTTASESLIKDRGEVLRLREITVKLDGILVFDDVHISVTLEDRPSVLNRDEKVSVELEVKTKKNSPTLLERFRNFYVRDSEEAMLQIRPKIMKRGGMRFSRSEHLSPPFEINGVELHSKCASSKPDGDLIEFVPTIPLINEKHKVIVKLYFQLGRPDATDLSDCIKLLEEKVEKKESVMDKLGCMGKVINATLMYGQPLSEMNSFAKMVFATADKLFTSIKNMDECKGEARALIRRIMETLEDAEKLETESDTFEDVVNCILMLTEETIEVVRGYVGGIATELGRRTVGPAEMLDGFKRLNQRLDETSTRLNLVINSHVLGRTKQIHNDVAEIHNDVAEVHENVTEIHDDVTEIRRKQEDQSRRGDLEKICKWLSDMEFAAFPTKVHGASHEGSGAWFLECEEFVEWKTGISRLLWCSGIPGSGKTTMSAIVLKHLCSTPHLLDGNCLLNVYCRHDMKSRQNVSNFLRCLWAQLASQRDFVSKKLSTCYDRFVKHRMEPSPEELVEALRDEFLSFPIVYVVVDGLDECGDDTVLEEFATKLKELGIAENTRLFVTSRPYPNIRGTLVPEFRSYTLIANRGDMERYIEKQFGYPKSFGRMVDNSTIISRQMIADTVIGKAGGMFLLIRLHMGSLQTLGSSQAIKDRLDQLANLDTSDDERAAKVLSGAYDDTMKRVQEHPLCEPAMKLLQWIVYVQEPQTIGGLRYAISRIKPTDVTLNDNALTDEDSLISACAGLINVNRIFSEYDLVRVVHETTEVYLRQVFGNSLSCHATLMNQCLQALSLPLDYLNELGLPRAISDEMFTPPSQLHFVIYAFTFWSAHARNADEASEYQAMHFLEKLVNQGAFEFIKILITLDSRHNAMIFHDNLKYTVEHRRPSPVHLAAFFGLHRSLGKMRLEGNPINRIMDRARCTPLTYAIIGNHIESVDILLKDPSVDLNWRGNFDQTPLTLAMESGDERIVKLLLDQDRVNCDCQAVLWGITADINEDIYAIVRQLHGRDDAELPPLLHHFCAVNETKVVTSEMVQTILEAEKEFNPNWQDELSSSLWQAVRTGRHDIITLLLENGADPWIATAWIPRDQWQTPLLLAVHKLLDNPRPPSERTLFVLLKHLCKDRIIEQNRFSSILNFIQSQAEPVSKMIPIPTAAAWVLGGNHPGACTASFIDKEELLRQMRTDLVAEILQLLGINLNVRRFGYSENLAPGLVDATSSGQAVLSYAVQQVDYAFSPEMVRLLLSQGANPTTHDNDGRTSISHAAARDVDILKVLLNALDDGTRDESINDCDNYGRSPLSYAATFGKLSIVELLVGEYTADFNMKDARGRSILSYAVSNDHSGNNERFATVTRFLLDQGADPTSTDLSGRSVLSYAAQNGFLEIIRAVLDALNHSTSFSLATELKADEEGRNIFSYYMGNRQYFNAGIASVLLGGGDINEPDGNGRTPLMYAAQGANCEAVTWLLTKGAALGIKDKEGRTALIHAASADNPLSYNNARLPVRSMKKLMQHESSTDLNDIDVHGRSALSYAVGNPRKELALQLLASPSINADPQDVYERTPLSYSAEKGCWEVTVSLLARDDVQPNTADHKGRTPLSYAAGAGDSHVSVGALLDRLTQDGIEFNIEDNHGRTPWSYALEQRDPATIAEFLLHDGEKVRETDNDGRTFLSRAAQDGWAHIVGVFLEFSTPSDINIQDKDGRTAVSYAAQGGYRVIAARLFRAGADLEIVDRGGKTPLSYAREQGHTRVVDYLEQKGAQLPPSNLESQPDA